MEVSDTQRRKLVAARTIYSLEDVLKLAAKVEARQRPFPVKFKGGTQTFKDYLTLRDYGYELYVNTNISKYTKMLEKLENDVPGNPEKQARTIRRLLKGKKISGTKVVKDEHLERMGMIWGLAETVRNPSSVAHLLVVLHLVKKGLINWDDTVGSSSENRYVPSGEGEGMSRKLQKLRQEMVAEMNHGTPISTESESLTEPYRKNLGLFLQSACAAYDNMSVKLSSHHDGEIKVLEKSEEKAWLDLETLLENKILAHLNAL